jgi:aryl-alcohol dehydrogenase-like predicted oxidoreductase
MRHVPITGEGLRRSVERSLRRLSIDAIDILLLHEPIDDRIPSIDALFAAVTDLRRRGLIRLFGLEGSWHNMAGLDASFGAAADVLQTAESEWTFDRPPDLWCADGDSTERLWDQDSHGTGPGASASRACTQG